MEPTEQKDPRSREVDSERQKESAASYEAPEQQGAELDRIESEQNRQAERVLAETTTETRPEVEAAGKKLQEDQDKIKMAETEEGLNDLSLDLGEEVDEWEAPSVKGGTVENQVRREELTEQESSEFAKREREAAEILGSDRMAELEVEADQEDWERREALAEQLLSDDTRKQESVDIELDEFGDEIVDGKIVREKPPEEIIGKAIKKSKLSEQIADDNVKKTKKQKRRQNLMGGSGAIAGGGAGGGGSKKKKGTFREFFVVLGKETKGLWDDLKKLIKL